MAPHPDHAGAGSWAHARVWCDRTRSLRNVVRQEVVRAQVRSVVGGRVGHALDVGAGQGTQAIALAREGWTVTALDPDPSMRAACRAALGDESPVVADRVDVVAGDVASLDVAAGDADLVLCHGVLMYLADPAAAVAAVVGRVRPDGWASILTRNAAAVPFRPARRGDWTAARAALDEVVAAAGDGRRVAYTNELGAACHADRVEDLVAGMGEHGLVDVAWFGVRVAVDDHDPDDPGPTEPADREALLAVEVRLGARDPFRGVAPLVHVVGRRPGPAPG